MKSTYQYQQEEEEEDQADKQQEEVQEFKKKPQQKVDQKGDQRKIEKVQNKEVNKEEKKEENKEENEEKNKEEIQVEAKQTKLAIDVNEICIRIAKSIPKGQNSYEYFSGDKRRPDLEEVFTVQDFNESFSQLFKLDENQYSIIIQKLGKNKRLTAFTFYTYLDLYQVISGTKQLKLPPLPLEENKNLKPPEIRVALQAFGQLLEQSKISTINYFQKFNIQKNSNLTLKELQDLLFKIDQLDLDYPQKKTLSKMICINRENQTIPSYHLYCIVESYRSGSTNQQNQNQRKRPQSPEKEQVKEQVQEEVQSMKLKLDQGISKNNQPKVYNSAIDRKDVLNKQIFSSETSLDNEPRFYQPKSQQRQQIVGYNSANKQQILNKIVVRQGIQKKQLSRQESLQLQDPLVQALNQILDYMEGQNSLNKKLYPSDLFKKVDQTGQGFLNRNQFLSGLDKLDLKISEQQKMLILNFCDPNRNNNINYNEFIIQAVEHVGRGISSIKEQNQQISQKPKEIKKQREVKDINEFNLNYFEPNSLPQAIYKLKNILHHNQEHAENVYAKLDSDKDGIIDEKEFKIAFEWLKLKLTSQQQKELMKLADLNSDGILKYKEFLDFIYDYRFQNDQKQISQQKQYQEIYEEPTEK